MAIEKSGVVCTIHKGSNLSRLEPFYFYVTNCKYNGLMPILGIIFIVLFYFFLSDTVSAEISQELAKTNPIAQQENNYAGEFFNIGVPLDNYYFVKGVLMVFGNKFGEQPKNPQEEEAVVWDQLLLSYEAFRRGINVEQAELDNEVLKILQADKAGFDWKKDKAAYENWVKEKVNATAVLFENQIRHILQIQKLREQVMASFEPEVYEKEAYQEFLDEHNTLGIELIQFDERKAADEFYKKVKSNPEYWEEEKKIRPQEFKSPGFTALEFLMDIWKFPRHCVYRMMKMDAGSIYPPTAIYKGYVVFKVLEKRPAHALDFSKHKNTYYAQIRERKRYGAMNAWFESLKKQANIKIYPVRETNSLNGVYPEKTIQGENKEAGKNG